MRRKFFHIVDVHRHQLVLSLNVARGAEAHASTREVGLGEDVSDRAVGHNKSILIEHELGTILAARLDVLGVLVQHEPAQNGTLLRRCDGGGARLLAG